MRFLLSPAIIIYLPAVWLRNKLFDAKILPSKSYPIPIICVGNLSVGGTGKTPHTEYIINLLHEPERPVAILSRGYGRKTKGFLIVKPEHTYVEAGDESCQYAQKFQNKNVIVAVDSKRTRGIDKLLEQFPNLKAIVLDDAFQHRYVRPGLSIVLSDYYNPFYKDLVLPLGNLREPKNSIKRAHIIVITKAPEVISPKLIRDIRSKSELINHQHLFFSKIIYGNLTSIQNQRILTPENKFETIFSITGIANPFHFEEKLKTMCSHLKTFRFQDHHPFSSSDIQKILNKFDNHFSTNKIIVTTEKDAMRLKKTEFSDILKHYPIYYLPITIDFNANEKQIFDNLILRYVS